MVFDQLDYGLTETLRIFFISGGVVGFSIGSVKLFFDGTKCLLVLGCSDALRIYRFAW
jgi:predicted aspartyl protease